MSNLDIIGILAKVGYIYVPFLFALCFHEFSHAWMSKRLGDNTAEMMGRLTLNPMAHMVLIGTVILPLSCIVFEPKIAAAAPPLFFGWAKPVPYNPRNLKNLKRDEFWIASAGPLSNVLLAMVASMIWGLLAGLELIPRNTGILDYAFRSFIIINLFLAVFNMIPIHPLDGGKVLARFISHKANQWLLENQQMLSIVLMALVFTGSLRVLAIPVIFIYQHLIGLANLVSMLVT